MHERERLKHGGSENFDPQKLFFADHISHLLIGTGVELSSSKLAKIAWKLKVIFLNVQCVRMQFLIRT